MIKTLEDFRAYNLAMEIAEEVWKIVMVWKYFEKDTVGKQFVRAVVINTYINSIGEVHEPSLRYNSDESDLNA